MDRWLHPLCTLASGHFADGRLSVWNDGVNSFRPVHFFLRGLLSLVVLGLDLALR